MDDEYTSLRRRRLEGGELASASVRLVVLVALVLTYVLTGLAVQAPDSATIAVGAAVVLSIGYSVLCLRLVARSAFTPLLADLSAFLDAALCSLFIWIGLHPSSGGPRVALAGAGAIAALLGLPMSLLRLSPRNALVGAIATVAWTASPVIALLMWSEGGSASWQWIFVPAACLVVGVGTSVAARTYDQLLRGNLVTSELKRASRRLRMTMEIVQVSIANVGESVNDLDRVSTMLSEGARNQVQSLDKVSSAVSALNGSQELISRSTETSAKTIRRTVDSSDMGTTVAARAIEEMRSISETVERMVSALELIDDLADDTNLLALNASIEAGRGGPEGVGFSVVAEEIRALAEKSQATAVEVDRLVKKAATAIVAAGAASKNAGDAFRKIAADLAGQAGFVDELHRSVQDQLKGTREVERSVSRIHEVTMDNTRAADRVREVVEELQAEVAKLKALVDGKVTETVALT